MSVKPFNRIFTLYCLAHITNNKIILRNEFEYYLSLCAIHSSRARVLV